MASLEFYGKDEYGNSISINLPDFTGCLLLATTPTPPAGTLIADGSEVSRQAYSKLFEKIGTDYGEGDGVTTFALPDWRDEFPRFSGADRTVGTKQTDAIRNVSGVLGAVVVNSPSGSGAFLVTTITDGQYSGGGGGWVCKIELDASSQVPTADENRPRNVAFLPCIVYL